MALTNLRFVARLAHILYRAAATTRADHTSTERERCTHAQPPPRQTALTARRTDTVRRAGRRETALQASSNPRNAVAAGLKLQHAPGPRPRPAAADGRYQVVHGTSFTKV